MMEMEKVRKAYPGFVLSVDKFKVEGGMITGLVGANGSGKTTTFRLSAGLMKPDAGTVTVFDENAWSLPPSLKAQIGFVFADSHPNSLLTLKDIKTLLASFYPGFDAGFYDSLCSRFSLPMDKPYHKFSSGMKSKANLIFALCHHPRLLVLDEPTAGLDVLARNEIHGLLQEFMEQPGRSILISSHIASDLESLCDDFCLISRGEIVLHESVDVLLSDYGVLIVSDAQHDALDGTAVLSEVKTRSGWKVLVSDRAFYEENHPEFVIEKGNLDDVLLIVEGGKRK